MAADLLLTGGAVYDGTGTPAMHGDVLINGGRVEAIIPAPPAGGRVAVEAARVVDVSGLAVTPGFIDIHTHSDVSVLLDGRAQSKVHQGVTTEVTGNCGFSPFPFADDHLGDHLDLLAGIGDDPITPTWSDLDGYAKAVESSGIALNVAPLVGHGQLRIAEIGLAEAVSVENLEAMRGSLSTLLDQGAFGLSSGLTYVPSQYAETEELSALCRVLAEYDALYATHSRGDGFSGVVEAAEIGRASGARIQYSHIALNRPDRWGMAGQVLDLFDNARRSGIDIACDVYPYDASASALTQYLPAWVQSGGVEAMRSRLADDTIMRRAERDLAAGWGSDGDIPWFWDRVVLARTDGVLEAPEGATIEDVAADRGKSEARLVLELCREGGNSVQVVLFYRSEEDMRAFLRYDATTIGSDGSAIAYDQRGRRPHPRAFGAQARVLGRYARELGDVDLPTAVHKMTGAVAERLGLTDRGVLAPGKVADVAVFDPTVVTDNATFLDPCRPPSGIVHVVVNGQLVIDAGAQTSARPGVVLRSR